MAKITKEDVQHAGAQYADGFMAGSNPNTKRNADGARHEFYNEGFDDARSGVRRNLPGRPLSYVRGDEFSADDREIVEAMRDAASKIDEDAKSDKVYRSLMTRVGELVKSFEDAAAANAIDYDKLAAAVERRRAARIDAEVAKG